MKMEQVKDLGTKVRGVIRTLRGSWDGERVSRAFQVAREVHNC
jgi:hypothetical protein